MSFFENNEAFFDEVKKRGLGARPAGVSAADLDHLTPADLCELMPDYLRAGGAHSRKLHPLAVELHKEKVTLGELRERVTRSGMTSSDFSNVLAGGLKVLLISQFANYTADFRQIARDVPAPNYLPVQTVTLDFAEPPAASEDAPLDSLGVKVTAGTAGQLTQYAGTISFSRQVWLTYGSDLLAGIQGYAAVYAAIEQRLIATLLEAATLTTAATASLGLAGLEKVAKAMRVTEVNKAGQPCGLGIHALIVPAPLELTARTLRAAMDGFPAYIVVNPYLSSDTTWYAVANPSLSAKLLRLTLRDAAGPSIYMNDREVSRMMFAVSWDVGYSLSAMPGLIKATA